MPHCHRVHRILQAQAVEGEEARHILKVTRERHGRFAQKMATEGDNMGTWNLGFGSNMNVKNVTEKKLVDVLGKCILYP